MDPFPDSIHYTNSAFSLLKGKGYVVEREGRSITPDVPPLYPLVLLPFFAIFNDVRAFYFANTLLVVFSYCLFYRLVKKLFNHQRVQFLVLASFVCCLPLTWYATLAMAENLILLLFLAALNLLLEEVTWKHSVLMSLLCVAFYATKFASVPLLVSFTTLFLYKTWFEVNKKLRLKKTLFFLFCIGTLMTVFEIFEYVLKGTGIITQIIPLFLSVFFKKSAEGSVAEVTQQNVFFSTVFIKNNLFQYLNWMLGGKLIILWNSTQILRPTWAIPAFVGLFIGLTRKKWRLLSASLLVSLVSVLLFMMSFYTTDGRYFYTAIPTLFLGLGFALTVGLDFLNDHTSPITTLGISFCFFLLFFIPNIIPLKNTIMLNLRHAETPWTYISVIRMNDFIKKQKTIYPEAVTPVVITPLSPYYVDFFKTEKMTLLPLSMNQEARTDQRKVWGDYDYKHLHQVYSDFLKQHVPVYFASYGIGNDKDMQQTRDQLKDDFVLTEVDSGCINVCNIYQLNLKRE